MVIMCRQRDAENNDMIKPKPIHLSLMLLISALMWALVAPTATVSAETVDDCPSAINPLGQQCRLLFVQLERCEDRACRERVQQEIDDFFEEHRGPVYQIGNGDGECAEAADLSFDWGGGDCTNARELITLGFRLLAGIVGIAVVGGITWGGILYTTSNGNASKAQQGITTIVNSVIGLLLFIFLFALANFLVPGGVIR